MNTVYAGELRGWFQNETESHYCMMVPIFSIDGTLLERRSFEFEKSRLASRHGDQMKVKAFGRTAGQTVWIYDEPHGFSVEESNFFVDGIAFDHVKTAPAYMVAKPYLLKIDSVEFGYGTNVMIVFTNGNKWLVPKAHGNSVFTYQGHKVIPVEALGIRGSSEHDCFLGSAHTTVDITELLAPNATIIREGFQNMDHEYEPGKMKPYNEDKPGADKPGADSERVNYASGVQRSAIIEEDHEDIDTKDKNIFNFNVTININISDKFLRTENEQK